jgi:chromosome partitioning protein
MTRIIAISLSKGGVGKTTTAISLSYALAHSGRRVLLIDSDTQGQCSQGLGVAAGSGLAGMILENEPFETAVSSVRTNLDLLAGSYRLAAVKTSLSQADYLRKQMPTMPEAEKIIQTAVSPHLSSYDYVIIDTSPGWDILAINMLFLAHELILPIAVEGAAVRAFGEHLNHIESIQKYHDLAIRYILPTAVDQRVKQTGELLPAIKNRFGSIVCNPIRYNVRLSECFSHGQSIFQYAPKSKGAADYVQFTKRVIEDE